MWQEQARLRDKPHASQPRPDEAIEKRLLVLSAEVTPSGFRGLVAATSK